MLISSYPAKQACFRYKTETHNLFKQLKNSYPVINTGLIYKNINRRINF